MSGLSPPAPSEKLPYFLLETTANEHLGFSLILRRVCNLLGCPDRPRYVVFKSSVPYPGGDFRAYTAARALQARSSPM